MASNTNYRHGHARHKNEGVKSKSYAAWDAMKTRCYNFNFHSFHRYGGRGIKVCDRWLDSFENFLIDMGEPPTDSHSLDRYPNNDGDYSPENCRWATVEEQANNRG